jgi:hypothetical protein
VFAKSNGIVFCCISVGATIFKSESAFSMGVEIPKLENCFDIFWILYFIKKGF